VAIALALTWFANGASAADAPEPGVSPEVAAENQGSGPETFRIRLINRAGGPIEVSRDAGQTWLQVGSVVAPATRANPNGFTASRWAADSAVCASAVNALHIRVRQHPETGRGIVFSIVPAGEVIGAAARQETSAILTDIQGGAAVFGGGLAPYVNSPVRVIREGVEQALPAGYAPAEGDELVIIVNQPAQPVAELIFENRFGGLITLRYQDGGSKVIGCVLRPVLGIGRFEGTRDAAPGRIRANHPGVIDISTSPLGMIGGFQIVPKGHAGSPEVTYVRRDTQWMVVGPVSALDPSWEGIAPLFAGYLAPNYRPDDISGRHEDWMQRLLARCLVQARIKDGPWQNLPRICIDPAAPVDTDAAAPRREGLLVRIKGSLDPYTPLPEEAFTALDGVTHLRILLPRAQFWP